MGRLEVRVCGARGIGDVQKVSLPDPYVKVKLNSYYEKKKNKDEIKFRTRIIDNNLNPVWDELFKLQIADYDGQQVLFEVWNDNVLKDDMLGVYRLSLNGLTRGIMQDVWVILSDTKLTSPELHLRILAVDFGLDPAPGQATYQSIEAAEAANKTVVSSGHKKGQTGGQNTMTNVGGFAGQQQMLNLQQQQQQQQQQQYVQQQQPQVQYVQPQQYQQQPQPQQVVYVQQAPLQPQPQMQYVQPQQPSYPQQPQYQQQPSYQTGPPASQPMYNPNPQFMQPPPPPQHYAPPPLPQQQWAQGVPPGL